MAVCPVRNRWMAAQTLGGAPMGLSAERLVAEGALVQVYACARASIALKISVEPSQKAANDRLNAIQLHANARPLGPKNQSDLWFHSRPIAICLPSAFFVRGAWQFDRCLREVRACFPSCSCSEDGLRGSLGSSSCPLREIPTLQLVDVASLSEVISKVSSQEFMDFKFWSCLLRVTSLAVVRRR